MKKYLSLLAMVAMVCLMFAACGSEDEDTNDDTDGDTEEEAAVDGDETGDEDGDLPVGDEDEVVDGDAELESETAPEEDIEEVATCKDFSGAYYLEGACDPAYLTFFNLACVRQNENCEMELYADTAAFEGTVSSSEFEISSIYAASPTTCTGSQESILDPVSIECDIPAYSITCTGEATPMPEIEDASTACCDIMTQDCPEGELCTFVTAGEGRPYISACLAVTGTKKEDETCTRYQTETAGVGRDDCEKGLTCTNYGQSEIDVRACQEFCAADTDCAEGKACCNGSSRVPRLGTCVQTCDQWGDGSECPVGGTCAMITSINRENDAYIAAPFCMPGGSVAPNGSCSYNNECTTGYICSSFSYTCKPLCDEEHPCANTEEECISAMGYSYTFCENM